MLLLHKINRLAWIYTGQKRHLPSMYTSSCPPAQVEFLKKARQGTFWERRRYEFVSLPERKVPWCFQLHGKL